MGKPIIAGVKGEAAEIVNRAGAGITVTPEDVNAMADAMVQMANASRESLAAMGQRGREAYWANFSFATAISATESVLERAVTAAPGKRETA
jgi:glycosyltransferase involved in cell wall biosynthesis